MALRLNWYQKRSQGKLNEGEQIVAAVHVHTSYLMMIVVPDALHPFIGRHIVVTNERTVVFGPGMRSITAEYPRGAANASRTKFHLSLGDERFFVGGMFGPLRRIADQVIEAANAPAAATR